ncbi:MAG TPA: CBS domain-containing protein, partial [Nitrososphaerales archaeon]|nr:CBS domain-containing protein [Nitrososphaerales archaeon]
LEKSTLTASSVGKAFSYLFMIAGVFFLFFVDLFDGLWLFLIGWFVSSAATSEVQQMRVKRDLSGLKAQDVMTRNIDSVSPEITLEELSSKFLEFKHNGFPVIDSNGEVVGCVTMDDLRKVKKTKWNTDTVREIMTPKEKLVAVKESDPAELVVNLMSKNNIGRIFVLDDQNGKLEGLVTRSDIIKTIQTQETLLGRFGSAGRSSMQSEGQRLISVEKGMMFEIDCPVVPGADWAAEFNNQGISLISRRVVQLSRGTQTLQYTFEALQKGQFPIRFRSNVATEEASHIPSQALNYLIIVN